MSDINSTLDLIDGALHDWATSGDAMRWTPEPEQREETRELAAGGLIRWFDETHVWRENYQPERMGLWPEAMRLAGESRDPEDARRMWLNDRVRMRVAMDLSTSDIAFTTEPVEDSERE